MARYLQLVADMVEAEPACARPWFNQLRLYLKTMAVQDIAGSDDGFLIALAAVLGACARALHDADDANTCLELLWQLITTPGTATRVVVRAFQCISRAADAPLLASVAGMTEDDRLLNVLCRRQHDTQWEARESMTGFLSSLLSAFLRSDATTTAASRWRQTLQHLHVMTTIWQLTQDAVGYVCAAAWDALAPVSGAGALPLLDELMDASGGMAGFVSGLAQAICTPDPIPGRAAVRLLLQWLRCRHTGLLQAQNGTALYGELSAALRRCLDEEDWVRKTLVLDVVHLCLLETCRHDGGGGAEMGEGGGGVDAFVAIGGDDLLIRSVDDPDRPVRLK